MTDEVYALLDQLFEWDRMKVARNAIAHGVRFPEAASVFFDEFAIFEPDLDHSEDENRYVVLGTSIQYEGTLSSACAPRRADSPHQCTNRYTPRTETL